MLNTDTGIPYRNPYVIILFPVANLLHRNGNGSSQGGKFEGISYYIKNSEKIVTAYTNDNRPFRVYDLSFPTIFSGGRTGRVLEDNVVKVLVPLQKFTIRDYFKWLVKEDRNTVYRKINEFRDKHDEEIIKKSWYEDLKFKPSAIKDRDLSKIQSFTLGDLV